MNPNIDKEYQNIFRELKEEKMDWNFEDFLKKTEEKPEETKVIPLQKKSITKKKPSILRRKHFNFSRVTLPKL